MGFERFDVFLRPLVTFQQRLMFGLFLVVDTFSGLPAASAARRPSAIALNVVVRLRTYGAIAVIRRERLTLDFLLRQEKHATLIGVPRRLPVTDGFMGGMVC
jgi:hypothetical protein